MSAVKEIYQYEDFREYLAFRLDAGGRGARLKVAKFIGCQPSFISQVLSGRNGLSPEHAHTMNLYFNHSTAEAQYFIMMVLLNNAGSFELQKFLREQLRDIREREMQIHKVVVKHELHRDDLLYYYSNWICVAIHMLVSITKYQDARLLQEKIDATDADFIETVNFLTRTGLINVENGKLVPGESHVHLKKTSPYAQSATLLTRLKILEKLKLSNPRSVNFTSNFTISKKAYESLRKTILDFVVQLDEHIQKDEPEEFCTLVLDLVEH